MRAETKEERLGTLKGLSNLNCAATEKNVEYAIFQPNITQRQYIDTYSYSIQSAVTHF